MGVCVVRIANRKFVTGLLSAELLEFAEDRVSSGRYGNVSEVVRTALRFLQERELGFEAHRDERRGPLLSRGKHQTTAPATAS